MSTNTADRTNINSEFNSLLNSKENYSLGNELKKESLSCIPAG
jgi:hypothetical protein